MLPIEVLIALIAAIDDDEGGGGEYPGSGQNVNYNLEEQSLESIVTALAAPSGYQWKFQYFLINGVESDPNPSTFQVDGPTTVVAVYALESLAPPTVTVPTIIYVSIEEITIIGIGETPFIEVSAVSAFYTGIGETPFSEPSLESIPIIGIGETPFTEVSVVACLPAREFLTETSLETLSRYDANAQVNTEHSATILSESLAVVDIQASAVSTAKASSSAQVNTQASAVSIAKASSSAQVNTQASAYTLTTHTP